tara:strand:- start:44 stop:649 length:606 start_codon:yes stop_codon:yes gene_type:complete
MSFDRDTPEKYRIIKQFLTDDICKIVEQYCLFKMLNEPGLVENETQQCPGTHSVHGDILTESLLLYAKPIIENEINLKLVPTYSYYRVYKPGDILHDHTDRDACEVSATITIGYRYNDKDDKYRWSLYGYVDGEKRYLDCEPGDAIIYKGCELEHGRDRFDVSKYSYQVQVFLHYVAAEGVFAEICKYDGRKGIGCIKKVT